MEQQTVKNLNVFLLGLAFMLVFAAFQTMGNVQTVILDSAKNTTSGQFTLQFLSKLEPAIRLHTKEVFRTCNVLPFRCTHLAL